MATSAFLRRLRPQQGTESVGGAAASTTTPQVPLRADRKDRIQDIQQAEMFDRLPEIFPRSYSLGLLSLEDMRKLSGGIIITSSTVKKGVCAFETLEDPRMGPIDPGVRCPTCSQTRENCRAHSGFMPFPVPIINPHPDVVRDVVRILNIVCGSCSRPLISMEEVVAKGLMNISGEQRLKRIERIVKDRTCRREPVEGIAPCVNRIYLTKSKDENNKDLSDDVYSKLSKQDRELPVKVAEIFEILDKISDEDARMLGFEAGVHPRNMIMWGMMVVPPAARLPNPTEHRVTPHDLTKKYQDILKEINKIKMLQHSGKVDTEEYSSTIRRMRTHVKILIGITEQAQGKKVTVRSIKKIIQGKQGLILRNLQGKRTNNSARTVFSLDPNLRIGQIGVPKMLARKLTVREAVTPDNIEQMTAMLRAGDVIRIFKKLPGRKSLHSMDVDGEVIKRIVLVVGDEVERASKTGDVVFFNRNPSLSKQSVIAAEIVVTNDRLTLDIHLSYAAGLNADFDGDEGNLFGPEDLKARAEAKELLHVSNMLISTQSNRPNMAAVVDAVTAAHMMTNEDTLLDPEDFQRLLTFVVPPPDLHTFEERLRKFKVPVDSGRALFSSFLPEGFYYHNVNNPLLIQDGILISGVIKGSHIGSGHYTIIQALFKDISRQAALDFIDNVMKVGEEFLKIKGLTIGVRDFLPDDPMGTRAKIQKEYQKALISIEALEKPQNAAEEKRQEKEIFANLNRTKVIGERIMKEEFFGKSNFFKLLVEAGTKGDATIIANIVGMLGQQVGLSNERIAPAMTHRRRCLPIFDEDDPDPRARGYCLSSYSTGLTPSEFFFHTLAARTSLISKFIITATVGYFTKSLNKSLEDVMVWKNYSVVSSGGWIIQGAYGYDGFNPGMMENVRTSRGNIAFFTNIKRLVGLVNNKHGWYRDAEGKWSRTV